MFFLNWVLLCWFEKYINIHQVMYYNNLVDMHLYNKYVYIFYFNSNYFIIWYCFIMKLVILVFGNNNKIKGVQFYFLKSINLYIILLSVPIIIYFKILLNL